MCTLEVSIPKVYCDSIVMCKLEVVSHSSSCNQNFSTRVYFAMVGDHSSRQPPDTDNTFIFHLS